MIRTLSVLGLTLLAAAAVGGCKARAQQRAAAPDPGNGRTVTINGRALKDKDWATLAQLERDHGDKTLPDGAYWYDRKSGLFGKWGGPAAAVLPSGLKLGGSMKSDCSGRGTGVLINGRDIHPLEKLYYEKLLGQRIQAGRYWLDGKGRFGVEGPSALEILVFAAAAAQASRGGGGDWVSGRSYTNTFSSGQHGGANGAWSHTGDYGGGRIMVAGDNSGGGVMVDGQCVTWGW